MEAFPKTIGAIDMGYCKRKSNRIKCLLVFHTDIGKLFLAMLASSFLNRLANIAINQVERKLIAKLPKVLTRL